MRLLYPFALFAFVACSSSSASNDAPSDDAAATTDSSPSSLLTCDQLVAEFGAYVAAHSDCSVDSDCAYWNDAPYCDCGNSLAGMGIGIRADAVAGLNAAFNNFDCIGYKPGICDVASPSGSARCDAGKCVGGSHSCLDDWYGDSGSEGGPEASVDGANEAAVDGADEASTDAGETSVDSYFYDGISYE